MKTKKTFAGFINIILAVTMVLSLASCGNKISTFSQKIDAMEAAVASGNREEFEKASEEAVIFLFDKLKINMLYLNETLPKGDKDGKITELIDRMFEICLSAPAQSEEDFEFKLSDDGNGVIITGYNIYFDGWKKDIGKRFTVIPSEIQGLPVIMVSFIKDYNYVTSYTMSVPGSVKIYKGLVNCYNLKFAEGVEQIYGTPSVDYSDHYNGTIRKVDLPSSLKRIGKRAFEGQINLESINFGPNIVSIGNSAFRGCKNLKEVTLPDSLITIDDFAFYGSGLENVTLPANLKLIGGIAFARTDIESISIPEGVIFLGAGAFDECENLKSLNLPASVKYIFYNWDTLTYSTGTIAAKCNNLEKLELADGFNPDNAYFTEFGSYEAERSRENGDYTKIFSGEKINSNLSIQKMLKSHTIKTHWKHGTKTSVGKEYNRLKEIGNK